MAYNLTAMPPLIAMARNSYGLPDRFHAPYWCAVC